jgi:hypothetical protein
VRVICFLTGLIIYTTSFFLPAVDRAVGWQCALRSLEVLILRGAWFNPLAILVLLSGFTNPAVVVYVCLRVTRRRDEPQLKWAITAIIFACASCVFLAITNLTAGNAPRASFDVHVGYFAWIGGILLIVGGDLLDLLARYVRIDY